LLLVVVEVVQGAAVEAVLVDSVQAQGLPSLLVLHTQSQ
jgi:hypothetical protein